MQHVLLPGSDTNTPASTRASRIISHNEAMDNSLMQNALVAGEEDVWKDTNVTITGNKTFQSSAMFNNAVPQEVLMEVLRQRRFTQNQG